MQIRTLKYRPGSADRIVLIPFLVDKLGVSIGKYGSVLTGQPGAHPFFME
jgi:hypothetical protein